MLGRLKVRFEEQRKTTTQSAISDARDRALACGGTKYGQVDVIMGLVASASKKVRKQKNEEKKAKKALTATATQPTGPADALPAKTQREVQQEKLLAKFSPHRKAIMDLGFCYDFQLQRCKQNPCPHKHVRFLVPGAKGGKSKGKGKGKKGLAATDTAQGAVGNASSRGPAPPTKLSAEELERRKNTPCPFHAQGKCTYGDKCHFSHAEKANGGVAATPVAVTALAATVMHGCTAPQGESEAVASKSKSVQSKDTKAPAKSAIKLDNFVKKALRIKWGFAEWWIVKVVTMLLGSTQSFKDQWKHQVDYRHPTPASYPLEMAQAQAKSERWSLLQAEESGSNVTASTARASAGLPRYWIGDTGATRPLVSGSDLVDEAKATISDLSVPQPLDTAAGRVVITQEVALTMEPLSKVIKPLVSEGSPAVFSIGMECEDGDFSFYWPNWRWSRKPVLYHVTTGFSTEWKFKTRCLSWTYCKDRRRLLKVFLSLWLPQQYACRPLNWTGCYDYACDAIELVSLPCLPAPEAPTQNESQVQPQSGQLQVDEEQLAETKEQRLRAIAKSVEHQYLHFPKNPYCEACVRGKMHAASHRKIDPVDREVPAELGKLVTVDHITMHGKRDLGLNRECSIGLPRHWLLLPRLRAGTHEGHPGQRDRHRLLQKVSRTSRRFTRIGATSLQRRSRLCVCFTLFLDLTNHKTIR